MPGRALLLLNRRARRADELAGEAAARLRELGLEVIEESLAPGLDPGGLIRRHRGAVDRVIVGGGDGTLGGVVEGLLETGLPLGILPLGTANNLARTVGIPLALPDACGVAARGTVRRIDVGRVNDRYFLTTASLGLSVRVAQALSRESKRRWGVLAYALVALRVLRGSRPFEAEIEWERGRLHTRTHQIVVGNGRYYGSAMTIAEDATIDDAWLDLYTLEARHWWQILTLLPALKRGSHGEHSLVETLRVRALTIRTRHAQEINADGEVVTRTPADFAVMPHALPVLAPPA